MRREELKFILMQIRQVRPLIEDQHLDIALLYRVIWLLGGAKSKVLSSEVVQKLNFV